MDDNVSLTLKLNNVHPEFSINSDQEMTEIMCRNNLHGSVQGFRRMNETEAYIDCFIFQNNIDSMKQTIENFKSGWSLPIVSTIHSKPHTMYVVSVSQTVPVEQMHDLYKKYTELEKCYQECMKQLLSQPNHISEEELQKLVNEITRLRKWQNLAVAYFPPLTVSNIIAVINEQCK